jgi:uncharacterized protein (DUF2147 family)
MRNSILVTSIGVALLAGALVSTSANAAGVNATWKTAQGTLIKSYSCSGGLGLKIMSGPEKGTVLTCGAKSKGPNKWSGDLFNPEDGKTYQGHAEVTGKRLKLQGCAFGIFCKTRTFTKVK